MNVLHLIPRMNYFGGTAKKLRFLFQNSKYGCNHFCAVGNLEGSEWLDNINIISLDCEDKILFEAKRVCSIVEEFRIDLIVSHFFHMSLVALIVSIKTKTPFIYQEHGIDIGENILKYPIRLLLILRSRFVIVNSYATAKMMKIKYPFIKNKIKVIYNGVTLPLSNSSYFLRKSIDVCENILLIGIIGRYLPLRKHALLIKAFVDVSKQVNNVHLVCLGEGGEEEAKVKKLANDLLPKKIHFLSRTPYVGSFLQEIDIYVNPAIGEAFGIATCEAMLMGKATIVARSGALPEYCIHGHNSIMVEPDDQKSLSDAILMLLGDIELRKRIGENAQKDISHRFSVNTYITNNNLVSYEAVVKYLQNKHNGD